MEYKNWIHKVIFKKFEIKKIISTSQFSSVYEGINQTNNTPVVLKIEDDKKFKYLQSEAYLLINLKGFGIPKLISYGKSGPYNILIEELLGLNLRSLWKKYGYKKDLFFKPNKILTDVCLIAIQILERLKYIHDKGIIHRDIKHHNFVIGRNDPNNIYLIDFGLSRKYKSSRTGKHIKYAKNNKLLGSLFFSSINSMKGYELSRRDDLESLGYTLIFLANGLWLPWGNLINSISEKKQTIEKIKNMKTETSEENLCKGLPIEFISYMKYVKHLEFEEDPDYKYLNGLFLSILSKNEFGNNLNFFWMSKQKSKSLINNYNSEEKKGKTKSKINITQKLLSPPTKNSSKNRLYNSIKNSLNKKKKITNSKQENRKNETSEKGTKQPITHKKFQSSLISRAYPELKFKKNLNDGINITKKLNFNSTGITQSNLSNRNSFKEEYLKIKRSDLKYFPKTINSDNLICQTFENSPKIKVYNNIIYHNLYLIKDNEILDNSPLNKLKFAKIKINKNIMNISNKKVYKSVIK